MKIDLNYKLFKIKKVIEAKFDIYYELLFFGECQLIGFIVILN